MTTAIPSIYDFSVITIDGVETNLAPYRGKTLIIVNVASRCGFTKQYAGLEELYRKYKNDGLMVLGFPCNQFGQQEPGTEAEIKEFCTLNYQVSFPLFAKIEVNGPGTHPLYAFLKQQEKGLLGSERIKWNFTKFLINREGDVLKRFSSQTGPTTIEREIQPLLQK